MGRPEIIRPPVDPGYQVTAYEEKDGHGFVLATGERLRLTRSEDSRDPGEIPTSMSQALRDILLYDPRASGSINKRGLKEDELIGVAQEVLGYQFGLGMSDSGYWAREIVRGDNSLTERIFPHWLYASILARSRFANLYSLHKPRFVTYRPSPEILKDRGLNGEDIEGFIVQTAPVLAGTAVPLLGNFGSNVRNGTRPEYIVLRPRQEKVGLGLYSFPGGRADQPLELTAWEELREEMPLMTMRPYSNSVDWSMSMILRRVDFLAIVDQVLVDNTGSLRRFLNYTFAFWLAFPYSGGGPAAYRGSVEEVRDQIAGADGDGGGEWFPVRLNRETMRLVDPKIENNLSPIAGVAMEVVRKRLHPIGPKIWVL